MLSPAEGKPFVPKHRARHDSCSGFSVKVNFGGNEKAHL